MRRHREGLLRWARRRLPQWARTVNDTADLVQDVLLQTFRRIDHFEDRGKSALRAYLRQAVDNRIRDELRRVGRRPTAELDSVAFSVRASTPSPFDEALTTEQEARYKAALATLSDGERLLVVSRLELGYTYEQLALITDRPTTAAARQAVRRAVMKLGERIAGAQRAGR